MSAVFEQSEDYHNTLMCRMNLYFENVTTLIKE